MAKEAVTAAAGTLDLKVVMKFGQRAQDDGGESVTRRISVAADGSDSIQAVKAKIAAAFGGKVAPAQLLLFFGPNEAVLGQQFADDPAADESALTLGAYSCLAWITRFPHWHLSVRFMPPTPLPPGVAAHRAAALSQGKDPDLAVRDARAKGEIPQLTALPKPWGPKPFEAATGDRSHTPAAAFAAAKLAIP